MNTEFNFEAVMCTDGDGVAAVFMRGHDAPLTEVQADAERYMRTHFEDDIQEAAVATLERWRVVPHEDGMGRFVQGTGRGSFPVTCVSFRQWDR